MQRTRGNVVSEIWIVVRKHNLRIYVIVPSSGLLAVA